MLRTLAAGTLVEYRAVSTDAAGNRSAASTYASVGNRITVVVPEEPEEPSRAGAAGADRTTAASAFPAASTRRPDAPATGSPSATHVQMTQTDGIWALTLPDLAAGTYLFKIATEKKWDENYGAGGVAGGGDIPFTHGGGPITFYFDPRTKNIRSTADGPVITLAGSFQSELGCAARLGALVPGRDDVRSQRRRRVPVHDR